MRPEAFKFSYAEGQEMLTGTGRHQRALRLDGRATQAMATSSRTAGKCCFLLTPGTGPGALAFGWAVSCEPLCQMVVAGICERFSDGKEGVMEPCLGNFGSATSWW